MLVTVLGKFSSSHEVDGVQVVSSVTEAGGLYIRLSLSCLVLPRLGGDWKYRSESASHRWQSLVLKSEIGLPRCLTILRYPIDLSASQSYSGKKGFKSQ